LDAEIKSVEITKIRHLLLDEGKHSYNPVFNLIGKCLIFIGINVE
jgi:hypothetical protein